MKRSKLSFYATLAAMVLLPLAATAAEAATPSKLDLVKVFRAAPIIYTVLSMMSIFSFAVWIYSLMTLRLKDMLPTPFINNIRELISQKQFEAALSSCERDPNFSSSIIACGIASRKHGPQVMMDAMQAEGRRSGSSLWQRLSFLSDVAIVAPMLGLLGTVIGLFFAFYDTNRSMESITAIFDGLGVAIGTTVAGLIVAILSMMFYTSLKFRLVSTLNTIENEVLNLVTMVEEDKVVVKESK